MAEISANFLLKNLEIDFGILGKLYIFKVYRFLLDSGFDFLLSRVSVILVVIE